MQTNLPVHTPPEDLIIGGSVNVKDGVDCLTLTSLSIETEDYGFIAVAPGMSTPEQLVWEADTLTGEAFVSGRGIFVVERKGGEVEIYTFNEPTTPFSVVYVYCGDTIKWTNTSWFDYLFIFEICRPAYTNGRFLDLE